MGSWSESCGFSGLEIGEGDVAYVCLVDNRRGSLNDGAFRHYAPITTLLRGTYNDYGYLRVEDDENVLALFNAQSGLALKNGDDFSIDQLEGRTENRWWIHGDAFSFLPTIQPEFPYQWEGSKCIKIKDIGAATDFHLARVRNAALAARDKIAKALKMENGEASTIMVELALSGTAMADVLGYGDKAGLNKEAFKTAIKDGVDIEPHLESYRRPFMLAYGLNEIRRNLAPNESIGPQHGGHVALRQLGKFLVETCDRELAGREQEDEE